MFHSQEKKSPPSSRKALKDLMRIHSIQTILSERKTVINSIRSLLDLQESQFNNFCEPLLKILVSYFQNLPSTNNSFYSKPGGMLDHALFRTEAALELFQQIIIVNPGEPLSEEQKLWQYALFSASLLQGVSKLYAELQVFLYDEAGNQTSIWNPLIKNLTDSGIYYDFTFERDPETSFKLRVNLILAKMMMPSSGFFWIASNPEVFATWLALLQEDQNDAGALAAILSRADALAIQYYFNEILMKDAKSSRLPKTTTFHSDLPEPILEKDQKAGFSFIQWIYQSLDEGKLVFNRAPLLGVPGGVLMSDEMYKLFVREHPEFKNWQAEAVRKGVLSLGLHAKNRDGTTTAKFEQNINRQVHSGDVLSRYALALPNSFKVYNESTRKTTQVTAVEMLYFAQFNSRFMRIETLLTNHALPRLSTNGTWEIPLNSEAGMKPGTRNG